MNEEFVELNIHEIRRKISKQYNLKYKYELIHGQSWEHFEEMADKERRCFYNEVYNSDEKEKINNELLDICGETWKAIMAKNGCYIRRIGCKCVHCYEACMLNVLPSNKYIQNIIVFSDHPDNYNGLKPANISK